MSYTDKNSPTWPIHPDIKDVEWMGLSKREMFAMHFMTALLSLPNNGREPFKIAQDAVHYADLLIYNLNIQPAEK